MERWKLYSLIAIFIIYNGIVIVVEFYYRKVLFEYSLSWIKDVQKNTSEGLKLFFRIITEFGSQAVLIPIIVITLIFSRLNKAYLYLNVTAIALTLNSIMKMSYGNPRPFWVDTSLFISCDGGYGNPSGHAQTSCASYLTLAHILTDNNFFKKRFYMKAIVFLLIIALIIAIVLSRLYLGVHSINQIIFGSLIGISVYFLFVHIFCLNNIDTDRFFKIFTEKSYIILISLAHSIIFIISLLVFNLINNDNTIFEKNLNSLCPNINTYRKFNNDGLFGSFSLFAVIGCHNGIFFLIFLLKKYNKNINYYALLNWNETKWMNKLFLFLSTVLFASPLILQLIISGKANLIIIYTFKVAIPFLISTICIYGLNIFFCIRIKIANPIFNDFLSVRSSESNPDINKIQDKNVLVLNVDKNNKK